MTYGGVTSPLCLSPCLCPHREMRSNVSNSGVVRRKSCWLQLKVESTLYQKGSAIVQKSALVWTEGELLQRTQSQDWKEEKYRPAKKQLTRQGLEG